ncbi:MAG: 2,3-bisphosphoglycerate-dependent phosphoglycerate mutase [Pseudonocardia sp.]
MPCAAPCARPATPTTCPADEVQLVLVRHALPERIHASDLAEADRPGGPADPGLTELGERQAARLVDALAPDDVAGLYVSPLARARGTAAPLAAVLGRDPEIVEDLREYDADSDHYVPVHEMARLDPAAWERMRAGLLPAYVDVPAFTARVDAAFERIIAAHPGRETAVVVAHAGVVNTWLAHLLRLDRPLTFPLDYTGITRILAGRDGRRLVRTVNEIAHVADLLTLTAGAE